MPAAYTVDVEHQLVLSRVWGTISSAEIVAHYATMRADAAFRPTFQHLVDIRDVTHVAADSATIRNEGTSGVFAAGVRRAIVTTPGFLFGIARMFAATAEARGGVVELFTDPSEAACWLGVPLSAIERHASSRAETSH